MKGFGFLLPINESICMKGDSIEESCVLLNIDDWRQLVCFLRSRMCAFKIQDNASKGAR